MRLTNTQGKIQSEGRVTASWRPAGQAVTLVRALLARATAGLLGNDPRPVLAAAGSLTLLTVTVAWLAGLRKEDASGIAVSLLVGVRTRPG